MTLSATSTREQILDAADRVLGRSGFRRMTMDDLAREAGVSRRTIYLHFRDKEDVGLSSISRVVSAVHQRLENIAADIRPAGDRLRDMLRERVMGRVRLVQAYHQGLDQLFEVVRPAYMERRGRAFTREVEMLTTVLEEGRRKGELAFEDATETATALLLATNAFLPYSLSVKELGKPAAIEARLAVVTGLLLRGLQAEPE